MNSVSTLSLIENFAARLNKDKYLLFDILDPSFQKDCFRFFANTKQTTMSAYFSQLKKSIGFFELYSEKADSIAISDRRNTLA